MKHVLDACAMLAYLKNETGAEVVEALLRDASHECLAHAVNLCEVYYDLFRNSDERTAKRALRDLEGDGIAVRRDISRSFLQQVGQLKARGRIAFADCFCVALAQHLGAPVVTSDHHEFDALAEGRICEVLFIR
ncbi:MAG: PIN domain-containing protein [Candidatus Sumerlaeaceae bacterium]